uniref:Uncharacterized protein n=1 Tax=Avena sativa TaxID=4498 RepID=A0ACD5WAI2_AVESA
MEAAAATSSPLLSLSGARRSPTFLRCSPAASAQLPIPPPCRCSSHSPIAGRQLAYRSVPCSRSGRALSLRCSAGSPSTEGWLLEPAGLSAQPPSFFLVHCSSGQKLASMNFSGDGDWKHIGYRVQRRGPIEITTSEAVTVGRVPEKADIVIPVATVSGVHARLEKKQDGSLVVTDMDSTNGTYINERKLVPGFPVPVNSGSLVIFGDIHLAMFRASKAIFQAPAAAETSGEEEAGEDDEQEVNNEVLASVAVRNKLEKILVSVPYIPNERVKDVPSISLVSSLMSQTNR